ncbi:MAG TPA: ornithine carbamoyltransferase [Candidatus Sulfotelmatobacter sp.]|jgi:ornithine carbamoyltransferase|nr:ornithine carbamoyltransferase [Candidatus Sulfotelmatobacter sp.]
MNAQAQAQGQMLSVASDLLTGAEWNAAQVKELFRLSADVKAHPERYKTALAGRFLAMIFEKPSLRTRVTFEVGIASLGGTAIYLDHADTHLGDRESIPDVARCLSRWVHGIVGRVFSQEGLEILAAHATVPVINALSDVYHPCQTLCDFFTLEEKFGSVRGLKFAYVGDGNNVCHSLMIAGAQVGAHVRIATPEGYEPDAEILASARRDAAATQGTIELFRAPEEAVAGAQAVYTDVWASMGQESETEARAKIFAPYQVNARLMSQAAPDAVFLHCLPAHRGSEVTDEVIESPRSIIFDEAENRLHVQKAILLTLLS